MKKPILAIVAIALITIVGVVVVGGALDNTDYSDNLFYRLGASQRETPRARISSDVYIISRDFTIYESEIEQMVGKFVAIGADIESGREIATQTLLRQNVLYTTALNLGFYATDEEVRYFIDLNIEMAEASSNFEEDVIPFLRGIGMSHEEYWESRAEFFRTEIAIAKLENSMRDEFLNINTRTIANQYNANDLWNEQWERIVEELIQSTEFTIVAP